MKKRSKSALRFLSGLLLLIMITTVCIIPVSSADSYNRMDGFTNDTAISESKYLKNSSTAITYHSVFQLKLAGSGTTAWNYATGKGVNVAIFDDGFDTTDSELSANIKGCYNAVTDKVGASYIDNVSHGTNCAKILAAVGNNKNASAGVAYNANLYLVEVSAVGTNKEFCESMIRAIDYAIANNCRVISCSLSDTQYTSDLKKAISKAYNLEKNSILFVSSGGNTGTSEYRYPASLDGVLAVSAAKYDTSAGDYVNAGSTHNDAIDIAGPGNTTSAATPYVAGTAALLFEIDPSLTAEECANIITSTASDYGKAGYDEYYGYGLVQPLKAVKSIKTLSTSSSTSKPKKTSIKKLTSPKKKQIKVTWKKKSGVTGYQVQYATNKKFTKNKKTVTVKGAKKTSKTIKKLKSKKTYYVRVRTYKTVNGKKVYSNWSTVKKVTTK